MSWIAVGVAAVAVVSSVASSQAQKRQQEQEAVGNQANAAQSIGNMQAIEAQSEAQELQKRQENEQYLGMQSAAIADAGTGGPAYGSNFAVGKQSAINAEMDALNVRYNGQLRADQQLSQAYQYGYAANVNEVNRSNINSAEFGSAALSAFSSGAGVYGQAHRVNAGTV